MGRGLDRAVRLHRLASGGAVRQCALRYALVRSVAYVQVPHSQLACNQFSFARFRMSVRGAVPFCDGLRELSIKHVSGDAGGENGRESCLVVLFSTGIWPDAKIGVLK